MGKCGSKNRRVGERLVRGDICFDFFFTQIGLVRTTTSHTLVRLDLGLEGGWVSCNCTGVSNQLTVLLGGLGYNQYGLESSCPEGVDQNTALLATAAVSPSF